MKTLDLSGGRETCSFCPKLCRHACPAAEAEGSEQATPTFKQQVAIQAASGQQPLDAERARVLYKCADCSATTVACRHRVSVGDSLLEARGQAVKAGVAPPEIQVLAERFAATGSPYSADLRRRGTLGRPRRGEIGIYPACTTLAHDPGGLPRIMTLLDLTQTEVTTALTDPPCCGYPLLAAGLVDAFRAHAKRVAACLKDFERIAVEGAGCAHTLGVRYAEHGVRLAPTVAPLVDVLAAHTERWRDLAPSEPATKRYAYHDPCALGRRLGRIEEPRAVLRAVLTRPD
ncbi:MAG: (Fe-S)-binding protein [Planctomycetes bacterium]|nr:(Fe-S)-binding protein [Planctomycetota bacterium]